MDIIFPIIQALPIIKKDKLFKRFIAFLTYRRKFKVVQDYTLYISTLGLKIFIPAGFIFDGASVPKFLYSIYNPVGILFLGALPHDFGYRYEGLLVFNASNKLIFKPYSKKELDHIFETICVYSSGMKTASKIATFALSVFGFIGWNENRKLNSNLNCDFPGLFVV